MKLIDVDNFLKQYSDQVCGDTIDAIDLRLALLKEPIVDAIPIEWLKKRFMDRDSSKWSYDWHVIADCLITYWEKENAID